VPSRPVTPASLFRRAFAERIAPAYASHAGVVAFFVGGSTARGHAEAESRRRDPHRDTAPRTRARPVLADARRDVPRPAAVAVVRAHAQIEGLWRLDAYYARGNPVAGYAVLTAAHEELLQTLLGLNRVYFSGLKSLEPVTADLQIAPHDLLERVRASYPIRLRTSKETLTALVEDTHVLIEEHVPEIDVGRLREILGYERPLWDAPADPDSGP
jgi:hypothetical protein